MFPILGRYGPFFLYSYTVVMGLGVLTTLWLAYSLWPDEANTLLDPLLLALLAALVGGRLLFLWLNGAYFAENPEERWQPWLGGLNYHGALLAAGLVLWLWLHRQNKQRWMAPLADTLSLALPLLLTFGWLACYLEGCGYGRLAPVGWFSSNLPDSFGVFELRYQTQLAGMASGLGLTAGICWLRRPQKMPAILRFWLALTLVSLIQTAITLLRGDPGPQSGPWRLDTIINALLTLLSAVKTYSIHKHSRHS